MHNCTIRAVISYNVIRLCVCVYVYVSVSVSVCFDAGCHVTVAGWHTSQGRRAVTAIHAVNVVYWCFPLRSCVFKLPG